MYEELSPEDATKLALQHLIRNQPIPPALMAVLEEHNIDSHFKDNADEGSSEGSDEVST